jgi:DNA-binding XRE family transcriptional regulator
MPETRSAEHYVPNEVVRRMVYDDMTPVRAWREHLGLTQKEVAERLGISLSDYIEQERRSELSEVSRERIAAAFGISCVQLDLA